MKRFFLLGVLAIASALPARALTLTVDVLNSQTLNLGISGAIIGPASDFNSGILWVDVPISSSFFGNYQSITGNMTLGANSLHSVHSGYNNYVYAGTLQLRNSLNGTSPLQVGDIVSGSAIVTFSGGGHGLTQSMFDGGGAPIYWGHHGTPGFTSALHGTLQGYAVSGTSSVPDAGWTGVLLVPVFVAFLSVRRRLQTVRT
jgi:hypothetical protein